MPEPRCIQCSQGIPLDTDTYYQYNGPVRCPTCSFLNHIAFQNGNVIATRAILEDKYVIRGAHSIPDQPLGDYQEATICLSWGAWKACAVMARRVIQGALLARGVQDTSVKTMLDVARNGHLLSEKQFRLATTVSFFGNKGAHPEDASINEVGEIEAANGLWMTKELLLALFPPAEQGAP